MTNQQQQSTIYTVDRGRPKLRAGQGLLAGLDVVIRHFAAAFRTRNDNYSRTTGLFTVSYPEERRELPQAFRNFPILLYDDETGHELCTSCFQCQRICPPQVIHMTQAKDPATGKPVPALAEFIIEYDACMSCGLCAEVCPFDAIKMDHEFELATDMHGGLTWNREQLNRPVSYYARIAPAFWDEVKASAYKKLEANVKRRSGTIGIAPQMLGRVQEGLRPRREPGTGNQEPADGTTRPVASTASPAAAPAAPDDKAARLAAIRAANAARQAQTAAGEPRTAAPESTNPAVGGATHAAPETQHSEPDKAARLAAIRAANAARRAKAAGTDDDKRRTEDGEPGVEDRG